MEDLKSKEAVLENNEESVEEIEKEDNNLENKEVDSDNKENVKQKSSKKKKVIASAIILILLLLMLCVYFILFNKNKKDSKPSEKVEIKEEDTDINIVKDYTLSSYKAVDQNRYGKTINVYLNSDNEYTDEYAKESKLMGSVKCITWECSLYDAYDNYVVISEKSELRVYNYKTDKLVFGPVDYVEDYEEYTDDSSTLKNENNVEFIFNYNSDTTSDLYAIQVSGKENYLYLVKANKIIKNFKDTHADFSMSQTYTSADSINGTDYAVFYRELDTKGKNGDIEEESESVNYILNLGNGKVVMQSLDNIQLYNPTGKNLLFVKSHYEETDDSYNSKLYNDKQEIVFDGIGVEEITFENNNYYLASHNRFYIYDITLNKVFESKKYNNVVMYNSNFALVLDGVKLDLLDSKGNYYTTFIKEYDKDRYNIHTMLSGWYKDEEIGKDGIYIVIGDSKATVSDIKKNNTSLADVDLTGYDLGYEYYYIPKTKESGTIATYIGGYAKPVMYLYPTKVTNVKVNFEHEDMLTVTYPKFNNEWNLLAHPNGNLYIENKMYYGLYWEENLNHRVNFSEGFYVNGDDAITFLESKLSYIGLTDRESNEFIMYWLPILEKNKHNLVYFELTSERDSYNKLLITPKPDSVLRVAIHVKKVNGKVNIKEEKLTKFKRSGFSVVEWGGVTY